MYCGLFIIFLLKVFEDGISSSQPISNTATDRITTVTETNDQEINDLTATTQSVEPPIKTEDQINGKDTSTAPITVGANNDTKLASPKHNTNKLVQTTTGSPNNKEDDKQPKSRTSNYGRLNLIMVPLIKAGNKLNNGILDGRNGLQKYSSASYNVADGFLGLLRDGTENMGNVLTNARFLPY